MSGLRVDMSGGNRICLARRWICQAKQDFMQGTIEQGDKSRTVTPHVSKPHDYVNHMFMRL
jgi:hypothetical protein